MSISNITPFLLLLDGKSLFTWTPQRLVVFIFPSLLLDLIYVSVLSYLLDDSLLEDRDVHSSRILCCIMTCI